MEPGSSPPTESLRQRITTALNGYRQRVHASNYQDLRNAISEVNDSYGPIVTADEEEEREQIEERVYHVYEEYLCGDSGYHHIEEEFIESLDSLEQFLDPHLKRTIVPDGTTPPDDYAYYQEEMRRLEGEVRAAAVPGEEVALPNEYRVLMSLAGEILPAGLPNSLASGTKLTCMCSIGIVQVPPLPKLVERLYLGPPNDDWAVYAGFLTGLYGYADEVCCGLALCEKLSSDGESGDEKGWRIFFGRRNGHEATQFDSIEEFLEWYNEYGKR